MEHPLSDMMTNSMSKIKDMIDVNTVVGSPITTPGGVTIIPVTKVSIGYGGGGSDFATKNMPANRDNSFGGGAGAGIKITPVAFLIVSDGEVTLKHITAYDNAAERVVNLVPEMFDKVTSVVNKTIKKKETQQAEAEQAANAAEVTIEEVK